MSGGALSKKIKTADEYSGKLLAQIAEAYNAAKPSGATAKSVEDVVEDLRNKGLLKPVLDQGKRKLLRANPLEYMKLAEEDNDNRIARITAATSAYGDSLKEAGLDDATIAAIGQKYEEIMKKNDELFHKIEFPDSLYEEADKTIKAALRYNISLPAPAARGAAPAPPAPGP